MSRAIEFVRADAEAVLFGRVEQLASLKNQNLFLSGGTGFLGSWLLELISVLNEKHQFNLKVKVLSRNFKAFAKRLPHLGTLSWISYQEGDIRHLAELPREIGYIIHAAALTDRRIFASHPSAVAETNSLGAMRIFRAACLLEDLKKFVLVSSALVYGRQPWELQHVSEEFSGSLRCDDVNSVYAESKRFAEVIAQCVISESKIPVVTVRPFAFVGPYQSLELPWAVTDFIRDSFAGGPIRIMGDGATVRSLMYASDFAFGVLSAAANGVPRTVYNIGSPEAIDLGSLAQKITQFFSPVPEIFTKVGQVGHERSRLVPSIDRAIADLRLEIKVSLMEALQRTITWNRMIRP